MIPELIAKYQNSKITSINDLKPIISEIQNLRIYFDIMENYRGHSLESYQLNSGLARYNKTPSELSKIENDIYNKFYKLIKTKKDYIREPFTQDYEGYELKNKWYSLFQAQHIGLLTRLMDWSIDWRVALMFAVENENYFKKNGTLTIFLVPGDLLYHDRKIKEVSSKTDPFTNSIDMMINTPVYMLDDKFDYIGEKRIGRQNGRFWVQSIEKSVIPLNEQEEYKPLLLNLIIDGESKEKIKAELETMGYKIDWHYYRKDEDVDDEIKLINKVHLSKNWLYTLLYRILMLKKYIKWQKKK
ncbi:FRG domain-containing protein [Flavobacterium aquariorum]|nr:FRG domain-containing protein [Flavobacterium aquariorum]